MSKITFIMSVYNTRTEWFERAVQSVLEQTNSNWQMIIIDDGSKEDIACQCDAFAGIDNRIKVHHQENQGLSVARNFGMDHTCSEWVTFIDADDWLEETYVNQVLEILDEHRDLELMGIGHDDIWPDRKVKQLWGEREFYRFCSSEKEGIQMALLQDPEGLTKYPVFFGAQWKFIYSTEFLNKYGIRNTPGLNKAQDSVFNLYVTEHAVQIGYYNKILYHYFHNNESVTGVGFNRDIDRFVKLLMAYKKFMEETGKTKMRMYEQAYIKVALLQFEAMLQKYFLHIENPDFRKQKKETMLQVFQNEPFLSLLDARNIDGLSFYRRMLFRLMRKQCYIGICCLYKAKVFLKR